jgi:hypothetical protein
MREHFRVISDPARNETIVYKVSIAGISTY